MSTSLVRRHSTRSEIKHAIIFIRVFFHTDKPGPPAAFDISEITNDSCFLAWNPPRDDGGSRVTNYIVERRAADSEIWHRLSSTVKQTTYRAAGLVKFKEYIFRVFAENQFGVGTPAEHPSIIARYPFGKSGRKDSTDPVGQKLMLSLTACPQTLQELLTTCSLQTWPKIP